jgi:hypothetical protein
MKKNITLLVLMLMLTLTSCENEPNDCLIGKITSIGETVTSISSSNQTITKTNLTLVDVCSGNTKNVTITLINGMNVLFQPVNLVVGNSIEY